MLALNKYVVKRYNCGHKCFDNIEVMNNNLHYFDDYLKDRAQKPREHRRKAAR